MNKVILKMCILPQDNGYVPSIHIYIYIDNSKLKPMLRQASPTLNLTHLICSLIAIELLSA